MFLQKPSRQLCCVASRFNKTKKLQSVTNIMTTGGDKVICEPPDLNQHNTPWYIVFCGYIAKYTACHHCKKQHKNNKKQKTTHYPCATLPSFCLKFLFVCLSSSAKKTKKCYSCFQIPTNFFRNH